MDCKTLDELMSELQKLREEIGGESRVLLEVYGGCLVYPTVTSPSTGKSDPFKLVTRGGVRCVLLRP